MRRLRRDIDFYGGDGRFGEPFADPRTGTDYGSTPVASSLKRDVDFYGSVPNKYTGSASAVSIAASSSRVPTRSPASISSGCSAAPSSSRGRYTLLHCCL